MVHARNHMACHSGLNDRKQMSTHMDTLAGWWDNAEVPTRATLPRDGDHILIRYNPEWFEIALADGDTDEADLDSNTRILSRAPKPKPAWHDAAAVTATATDDLGDEITAVWVREGDELWRSNEGGMAFRDDLRDVTPLIEAKVTDEMVKRAEDWYAHSSVLNDPVEDVLGILTAALGLEAA